MNNEYTVEIVLDGQTMTVTVPGDTPERATQYVLENIEIYVEDEPDLWDDD